MKKFSKIAALLAASALLFGGLFLSCSDDDDDDEDNTTTPIIVNPYSKDKSDTGSGSERAYTLTITAPTNGTVTADVKDLTTIAKGTKITLKVTPADGYELDNLTVKAGNASVAVINNIFIMPASNVTVTATFKTARATITFSYYGDTTNTTPQTVTVPNGTVLSAEFAAANTIAPEGYEFEAWIDENGTDYTGKAISNNVTLFAYFVKSSSSTSGTTTTTTTSEKSVETDKTTTVTADSATGTTVTKVEEITTKIGSTETVETESTTTKTADGTTTSESTVTTKDADGNATSKVETTVAADGTTTTTTTDASGKTTTETTGGSGEKLEVSLDNAGYPTFEIPIPQDSDIYIETLSISVYRKKNGDATYSKILDVYQNRKDSFKTNPSYEFTDLYVAKSASYSYYYQISGENGNGNFTKTSGKSDFVSITNGKLGELVASVSGGEVSFNAKTGILTLSTLPTVPSDFSYMLKMKNLDYGYWIRRAGTYYQSKGSTIDLFKTQKGKTLIPYWYVCLYKSDYYLREEWYPIVSEFYGADYGLPESITVPTEISTDTDEADTTLANTSYKSTELKRNGSAAPSGVSETISFASDGKNCTLRGYYNSTGTYTVSGTSVTVNFTSGDILGTMTGTLTNSNATLTAQGTVTVSGASVLMYGVFAKQGGGSMPTPTPSPSTTGLPASVGTNEFAGKTWEDDEGYYTLVFTADTLIEKDEDGQYTYRYSYDSQKKLLYHVLVSMTFGDTTIKSVDDYIALEKAEATANGDTYTSDMEAYSRAEAKTMFAVEVSHYEINGNKLTLAGYFNGDPKISSADFHCTGNDYRIELDDRIEIKDEMAGIKYCVYPTYSGGTSGTFSGMLFTQEDKVAVGEISGTYSTNGTGSSGCTVTLSFTKIPSALSVITTGKDYILKQDTDFNDGRTYTLK